MPCQVLHIQHNRLSAPLGPTFGALTSLTELLAHDNKFTSLPKASVRLVCVPLRCEPLQSQGPLMLTSHLT